MAVDNVLCTPPVGPFSLGNLINHWWCPERLHTLSMVPDVDKAIPLKHWVGVDVGYRGN